MKRCPASMWLYWNPHYRSFTNTMDYFFHMPHDPPGYMPVKDPFMIYGLDELYTEPSMKVVAKDYKGNRMLLAIVVLAITSILSMST